VCYMSVYVCTRVAASLGSVVRVIDEPLQCFVDVHLILGGDRVARHFTTFELSQVPTRVEEGAGQQEKWRERASERRETNNHKEQERDERERERERERAENKDKYTHTHTPMHTHVNTQHTDNQTTCNNEKKKTTVRTALKQVPFHRPR
jgi:hypothetical protein